MDNISRIADDIIQDIKPIFTKLNKYKKHIAFFVILYLIYRWLFEE